MIFSPDCWYIFFVTVIGKDEAVDEKIYIPGKIHSKLQLQKFSLQRK